MLPVIEPFRQEKPCRCRWLRWQAAQSANSTRPRLRSPVPRAPFVRSHLSIACFRSSVVDYLRFKPTGGMPCFERYPDEPADEHHPDHPAMTGRVCGAWHRVTARRPRLTLFGRLGGYVRRRPLPCDHLSLGLPLPAAGIKVVEYQNGRLSGRCGDVPRASGGWNSQRLR